MYFSKRQSHHEADVLEYWIINPTGRVYVRNEAGVFIGLVPVTDADELESTVFPELRIPMREVFGEEELPK